jgi:glycosyltransferase involved in cell wall biosynthesis
MENSGVSVVVCCFNSANRIRPVLAHLARQQIADNMGYEIVLVDNMSTDDTARISWEYWEECGNPFTLNLVTERQQGLSFARNAGNKAAIYPYIIFCDDDNWLSPGYAKTVFHWFESSPLTAIMGGWPTAIANQPLPEWFDGKKEWYACSKLHHETGWVQEGSYVFGAGMAARKQLLEQIFDERWPMLCSDRKGKSLSSGGDYEICLRASLLGYGIWFDETLTLRHFMEPDKLTEAYAERFYTMLPAHTYILQKYRKCLDAKCKKNVSKVIFWGWNYAKYIWGRVSGNHHVVDWTKDYLFYLTGSKKFATPESSIVFSFANRKT